jgi:uncharacterized protein (TIGR02145 family)
LPTQAEWNTLSSYVQSNSDCSNCAAKLLKKTSGWNDNGNGTDQYGFSALPGGGGYSNAGFVNVGDFGIWQSASEDYYSRACAWFMTYRLDNAGWQYYDKASLFSVRCVQVSP